MTNPPKPTRNEQREAARAKAKQMREQQKRSATRKRLGLQLGVTGGILAIVAMIVFVVLSNTSGNSAPGLGNQTPTNMTFAGGIKIGSGLRAFTKDFTPAPAANAKHVPNLEVYVDLQCPNCRDFEAANSTEIKDLVSRGVITLTVHPVTFLDRSSLNYYSSRAANAVAAVATYSPDKFYDYLQLLYQNQPQESPAINGPDNNQLYSWAQQVGADNLDKIKSAIDKNAFGSWVIKQTTAFLGNKSFSDASVAAGGNGIGTPFILVDGTPWFGNWSNPATFAQMLQAATTAKK